jgi:ribosome maturation factor RimP
MAFDIDRIREIAERVAASSGLEVVDIELRGGGKARMLRVFLDKPAAALDSASGVISGVTHEDCANFSREFGTILDVEDAVGGGSYTLEVSSPGLDRKLSRAADFERFVGSRLKLMTRQPINKNQHFEGRLESFENGRLTLDMSVASKKSRKKMGAGAGEEKIQIEFANVEKANLVPEI